jgi:hypothetical protein
MHIVNSIKWNLVSEKAKMRKWENAKDEIIKMRKNAFEFKREVNFNE